MVQSRSYSTLEIELYFLDLCAGCTGDVSGWLNAGD